jgi:hypothetical protein
MSNEIFALLTTAHGEGEHQPVPVDISLEDMPHTSDALKGPEAALWDAAIKSELASIKKAGVYDLVNPSMHQIPQVLSNKLILKWKQDEQGNISHYKA